MENKTYSHLFNDILEKVLQLSENPSQFAKLLTAQIREIIGVKTVLAVIKDENDEPLVFSVAPARKREWCSQPLMLKLAEYSFGFHAISYLSKDGDDEKVTQFLNELEIEKAIAIPLIVGNRLVGTILLLDLMDEFGIEQIIDLLNRLSGVFALVIRNSLLYHNLEELVTARTNQLERQNKELLEREKDLKTANEEYEVLNEELLENIRRTEEINEQLEKEIKRAEDSEAETKGILETVMDGFWIVDLKGQLLEVNEVACKMLGYKRQEILCLNILDLEASQNSEQMQLHIVNVIKYGEGRFESKHRRKNGGIIDVEISAKMHPSHNSLVVFVHDITERNLAIDELIKSEERYRSLLMNLEAGIVVHAPDTSIVMNNMRASEILGLSTEQMRGKEAIDPAWRFVNEDKVQLCLDDYPVNHIIISREPLKEQVLGIFHPSKDDIVWVTVNGFPVINDLGKITEVVVSFIDITERIQAEQERNSLQLLMDSVPGYAFIKDINLNYISANHTLCDLLKIPYDEIKGKSDFDIFPSDLAAKYIADDRKVMETGMPIFVEEDTPIHNSSQRLVIATRKLPWYDKQGKLCGIYGLSFDISELKNTEAELMLAKEHAEESDRLKTAFLQNMSHEIRTPMNAIMGFSSLLADNFNNKPKLEMFSEIIRQRSSDLLDIINDILDIAKIESGQLPVNMEECDLNDLFAELTTFFKQQQTRLGKEHIILTLHAHCSPLECIIVTDKVKLKQIFINLIGNALKFTEAGTIYGGCKIVNNKRQFYVSDTGIGIAQDKINAVFERFAQLNPGANKLVSGTGLGLAIVKGLVNLLGGEISLKSEIGKGSEFSFNIAFLTANAKPQELREIEQPKAYPFANKLILIVEDDFFNIEYLKEILTNTGLNILTAENGKEAVRIATTQPIDLVLMDIRLPDIDGYEATRQIKLVKPDLTIIAQTAYAASEDRKKALDFGCNDYISKPTKSELLLTMISKYLV